MEVGEDVSGTEGTCACWAGEREKVVSVAVWAGALSANVEQSRVHSPTLASRHEPHRKSSSIPSRPLSHPSLGISLWPHSYPRRAPSTAPARPRKGPARAGSRTHKARGQRKETHRRHQEERKVGANGLCFVYPTLLSLLFIQPPRMPAKSWPKISSGRVDMSRNSTRCALSSRPSAYEYRPSEVTSKWPTPCEVLPGYVLPPSAVLCHPPP